MGSKIGFILSLFMVVITMMCMGDLNNVSTIKSSLDALSVTVAESISLHGYVSPELERFMDKNQTTYILSTTQAPAYGDTVEFMLFRPYKAMVISKSVLSISVRRTAIVGYLN